MRTIIFITGARPSPQARTCAKPLLPLLPSSPGRSARGEERPPC